MDIYELNEIFQKKLSELPSDDENLLDEGHKFLQVALSYLPNCSDPIVGLYEVQNAGIKYDGYYVDEDEKEFHILGLLYYKDLDSLTERQVSGDLGQLQIQIGNFVKQAFRKNSVFDSNDEIGEHLHELKDDADSKYSVYVDIFSNVNYYNDDLEKSVDYDGVCKVFYEYHDASQIFETINAEEAKDLIVDFRHDYGRPLEAIRISKNKDFDVYLTAIEGDVLAKVYKDHKSRLMDGNVRAYLKRTQKTNRGIVKTIKDEPQDFVAYNNGISAVAALKNSVIKTVDNNVVLIHSLDRLQIVNGGQTTVTIYECSRDPVDLTEVTVPMKITILKQQDENPELTSNIAVYANTQTAIAKSDLSSNRPFYKAFESISRDELPCYRTPAHSNEDAYFWFFERANGLYNTRKRIIWNSSSKFARQFPEKNKFTKKILAKVIMAFSCNPTSVCLGNERCFSDFNSLIENNSIIPDKNYVKNAIAALIIWRTADKIILKNKLPIKAAVLPYTVSYISHKMEGRIDLDSIWNNQAVDASLKTDIETVAKAVSQYFNSALSEHPNTLMYGRKDACWEAVSGLHIPLNNKDDYQGETKINFFPEHPALKFIEANFNNPTIWNNLKKWNSSSFALSKAESEKIETIITQLLVCYFITEYKLKNDGKKIFLKACEKGYRYN